MAGRPRLDKHTVTGNLVDDPVVRDVKGSQLVTFRLADTPRLFDRETNAWKDGEPVFYDVAVKGARLGGNVVESLTKGNRATITGNYEAVPYVAKDGTAGMNHRVWAEEVSASLDFASVKIQPNPKGVWSESIDAQVEPVSVEQSAVDRSWGLTQ
jgi:single-strand DNA-binding protein